jgi:hypothetical protein
MSAARPFPKLVIGAFGAITECDSFDTNGGYCTENGLPDGTSVLGRANPDRSNFLCHEAFMFS